MNWIHAVISYKHVHMLESEYLKVDTRPAQWTLVEVQSSISRPHHFRIELEGADFGCASSIGAAKAAVEGHELEFRKEASRKAAAVRKAQVQTVINWAMTGLGSDVCRETIKKIIGDPLGNCNFGTLQDTTKLLAERVQETITEILGDHVQVTIPKVTEPTTTEPTSTIHTN